MIDIDIPGNPLTLEHLVMDYNGTLAVDGQLVPGVRSRLVKLADQLSVHVITADTFGLARRGLDGIPCDLFILPPGNQDQAKRDYVRSLGSSGSVCIGNGRNDRMMLEEALLGIAVILEEGASSITLMSADVVCLNIVNALDLLLNPLRLKATLRV